MTHLLLYLVKQLVILGGSRRDYLGKADSPRDLVGDVLPVDVSHPGAGDVLHNATTHPYLWRRRGRGNCCVGNLLRKRRLKKVQMMKMRPKRMKDQEKETNEKEETDVLVTK